ncbi:MAG TPA: zinc ribbon domain-containing protein [Nitrososphaerales archaeon]|nr:zinc ribbon domain-containing protein [Nitrososphaerales archaeon]
MQKLKFDARMGPTANNGDLYSSSWRYSFVHNFKVHFKVSILQALANKIDVSISSSTPQIPPTQQVMEEFNQRMQLGNVTRNVRQRFSATSYHVTNIEYKESFAFYDPQTAPRAPPAPALAPMVAPALAGSSAGSMYCRSCGTQLPVDSRFCNKCGTPVA